MSAMKQRDDRVTRHIVVLLGLTALVTVGGCLGLLWMRQQIEQAARETSQLEASLEKEERRLRYLDSKIAEIHQPRYLAAQVERLGLDLAPPQADRVVYLEAPRRKEAKGKWAQSEPTERRDPFRRAVDLAVMESFVPRD